MVTPEVEPKTEKPSAAETKRLEHGSTPPSQEFLDVEDFADVAEDTSRDATKGNVKDVLNDTKSVDVDVAKKDVVDSVEGGVGEIVKDDATPSEHEGI